MGVAIKEIVRRPWLFPAFARRRFTRLRRHQQQTFRAIANDRFWPSHQADGGSQDAFGYRSRRWRGLSEMFNHRS